MMYYNFLLSFLLFGNVKIFKYVKVNYHKLSVTHLLPSIIVVSLQNVLISSQLILVDDGQTTSIFF
jgi:hypothetical protein